MPNLDTISGIIPPLITPLTEDRRIDEVGLRRVVRHVLNAGVHGVFVMGSSGEFPFFDRDDRRRAIEIAADEVAGKVPVFAGISDSGTELAARNAKDAESVGAAALVLTVPYYFRSSGDDDIRTHYRHVGGATGLPLVMYNIPQTVKTMIGVDVIAQLAEEGVICAIKDSSTEFNHFQSLLQRMSGTPSFRIFQGSEFQAAASLLMGAHGCVLGIANIVPGLCVQLYESAAGGDAARSRELQRRVTAVSQLFRVGVPSPTAMKIAASILGLCGRTVSLPLREATEDAVVRISEIMEDCEVIRQVRQV